MTFPRHRRVRERDLAALEKEAGDRLEAARDFEAGVAAREKTARSQILNAKFKRTYLAGCIRKTSGGESSSNRIILVLMVFFGGAECLKRCCPTP